MGIFYTLYIKPGFTLQIYSFKQHLSHRNLLKIMRIDDLKPCRLNSNLKYIRMTSIELFKVTEGNKWPQLRLFSLK